jgi:IS30 family transposase
MAKKKAAKAEIIRGRGRPQLYPLTRAQEKMIKGRLEKGISVAKIAEELGVHEYAVLRVKRNS